MRTKLPLFLLTLFICIAFATPAATQSYFIPNAYKIATEDDAKGMQQFAKSELPQCVNCKGRTVATCMTCARFENHEQCIECNMKPEEATCRSCAGLGHFPDPLEHVHCPGCMGAGFVICMICTGRGFQLVAGSGEKKLNCVACKDTGGWSCAICDGKRLVAIAKPKPDLQRAKLDRLRKAQALVTKLQADLKDQKWMGKNTRKDVKNYVKMLKPAAAVLPPRKRTGKAFENVIKKTQAGSVFQSYAEREQATIKQWIERNVYYLQHQQHLLELAIAKAEHNEKAAAEAKKKKEEDERP